MYSKPRSFKDQAVSSADGLSPVNKSTSESRPQTTQSKHYISGMFRQFPLYSSLEEQKMKKFHLMEKNFPLIAVSLIFLMAKSPLHH